MGGPKKKVISRAIATLKLLLLKRLIFALDPMAGDEKQNRSESDLACTRCRERKIRCGRERPHCANCERDDASSCLYQYPAKRVNHLKMLCDSVGQLQHRLTTIESHLGRLTDITSRSNKRDDDPSAEPSPQACTDRRGHDDEDDDDDDSSDDANDIHRGKENTPSSSLYPELSPSLHVFRNQADLVDRYHGPSSLYVLCTHFRLRTLATRDGTESGSARQDLFRNMCEIAGSTEPFPLYSDQSLVHLLPKQQALTALEHFFKDIDYTTDIFVQSNLHANLEFIYSQPLKPSDEAWPICFKTIVLLVLGKEVSAQGHNALFGDFARSLLPSRAALINSRLLNTPRLINVQTLILLSLAAQQFDPHGWAEQLFTHACMLARTMGLQHAHDLPDNIGKYETLERAKVLRSLYTRDKSLCTTRGCIPWLSRDDCDTAQLDAAVERPAPSLDRLELAKIQDDVYRIVNADAGCRPGSNSKTNSAFRLMKRRLDQYMHTVGIFDSEMTDFPRRALLQLEFLATRILALQYGSKVSHARQVRLDARASCQLLLIAHGDQDHQILDAFHSITCRRTTPPAQTEKQLANRVGPANSASILDAFSVPAFFILLEYLLHPTQNEDVPESIPDVDLLRRVSACYSQSTERMQPNSYHRKVALIFDRMLKITELSHRPLQYQPVSGSSPGSVAMRLSDPSTPVPSLSLQTVDSFPNHFPEFPQGDLSTLFFQPITPPSASTSWDNWLSLPFSLGPTTPCTAANALDGKSAPTPDLLARDGPEQSKQWPPTPEPSMAPKRRRIHHEPSPPM